MSVFTQPARGELEDFLRDYPLGRLRDVQPIEGGTENSNFFVSLERGEFVLTLVERGGQGDLPFVVELLDVLHTAGLTVPYVLRDTSGEARRHLAGRPALLQPRLDGRHVETANPHHCLEVGRWLARMHLATRGPSIEHPSDRGLDWMLAQGGQQAERLPEGPRRLLEAVLDEIGVLRLRIGALPQSNLHADLFRDNVLFDGPHLSGVIDFYNACSGPMLYDLAIAVNDWCSQVDGGLDEARGQALLGAYAALRPFTPAEAELWPAMLRIACVRFWLSRLIAAQAFEGQGVLVKDPAEFHLYLSRRQRGELPLPFAL
ncbi:homoserine kinase [Stutzerimonas kirkiae]|uniref:Homoserine kinase n=1 Tax=Stutzerimonas kirkiae TaxID=2211392 RepID=A0A4Q9R7V9_9GAMM|nr:homoserine kinase [Stutzerimonas kirkiae]TBU96539.1 homoserine kinase [Stutzerimonas kirkiae]TBV02177.1 homoserine kinase [Stutzerimonas kirkiae]TBV08846.1 homoserine kinase [Stutzerimonas kirkiae]TBV15682.1 homoserine kinase [Stutzerimonas kirkiae]